MIVHFLDRICLVFLAGFAINVGLSACKSRKDIDRLFLPVKKTNPPSVIMTNPDDKSVGFQSTEPVWVLFDRTMDRQKTEDAFRLSSILSIADGDFRWEFNRMYFQPRLPLTNGQSYTMVAGASSESADGVDLGKDITVRFYAGTDITPPRLLNSTPAAGATNVDAGSSVTLFFSEAIDYASIANGLSISPSITYSISIQNDGKDIMLVPSNPIPAGTFRVTLTGALTDPAGNPLENPGSFLFTVGNDFVPPVLIQATSGTVTLGANVTTAAINKTDPIVLTFSEPMDSTSVEEALSISPFIASNKEWNAAGNRLTLFFKPFLEPETYYTLSLASSARDRSGNSLASSLSFPFLTGGPFSTRPAVIEVRQFASSAGSRPCVDNAGRSSPLGILQSIGTFDTAQWIDKNGDESATDCVLQFRFGFNNGMNRTSLVHATSSSIIIAPDTITGEPVNVTIEDLELEPLDPSVMILSVTGVFPGSTSGSGATPLLLFKIRGGEDGAMDTNGNRMKEDFNLYLTY